MNHDKAYELAVKAGCKPFWFDGIMGPAWHCGCPDDDTTHFIDSQCAVVEFYREACERIR